MNIVFLGLASTYTPGLTYQDNELCRQTVADGHQVTYISNPEKFVDGKIVPTGYEDTILPDGMRLIRLPYCKLGPDIVTKKLRWFKGVYEILEQTEPDLIFCHNTQYLPVLDVVRYKKNYPKVRVLADTHTAAYNSGTNWLSLHIQHRLFYKYLVQKLLPCLEKYFYIGESEKQFSIQNYGVPEKKMEFYPLGGTVFSEEEYAAKRQARRGELGVDEDTILLLHTGKLDALKRTDDLLRAFAAVPELKAKLAIVGSIPKERKELLSQLIEKDERVQYLGWKTGAELLEYLCACDLYCQPGSVSATLQNAVCCGSPIMAYPHEGYVKDLDYGNILWVETEKDMESCFRTLLENAVDLSVLKRNSARCAKELLDYRTLAARLYV